MILKDLRVQDEFRACIFRIYGQELEMGRLELRGGGGALTSFVANVVSLGVYNSDRDCE